MFFKRKQKTKVSDNTNKVQYFYIWRGWWQLVGNLIYDNWNGAKFHTHTRLNDSETETFESMYKYRWR